MSQDPGNIENLISRLGFFTASSRQTRFKPLSAKLACVAAGIAGIVGGRGKLGSLRNDDADGNDDATKQ